MTRERVISDLKQRARFCRDFKKRLERERDPRWEYYEGKADAYELAALLLLEGRRG